MTAPSRVLWLAAPALALPLALAAAEDFGFMPRGGKALLFEVLGARPDPAELGKMVRARRSEEEWRAALGARARALTERQLATLAAYLAVNMPLPEAAAQEVAKGKDPAAWLPPDGRELGWTQCQACHSLFSSHLTQIRDVQGWRNVFLSPFHKEMKMSAQEREEFARYSALNMPMKIEDVPSDLRF